LKAIVVDASFLVHVLTGRDSARTQWAERIYAGAARVLAPHLLYVEVANALRKMHLRKELTFVEMRSAIADMLELGIELEPFEPHAKRALELVNNVTPYDAWYVAIAETWGLPLATGDGKLRGAVGPRCAILAP
jgi:predicted nucleic acid-binding protein